MVVASHPLVRWTSPTVPLSAGELSSERWAFASDFLFAAHLTAVPIVQSELLRVAHEYPIAFAKLGSTWFALALLRWPGTVTDFPNRFVDGDGHWKASYVPFLVRTFPFTAIISGTEQSEFSVELVQDPSCLNGGLAHPCQVGGAISPESRSVESQITQALSASGAQSFAIQTLEAAGLLRMRPDLGGEFGLSLHVLDLRRKDAFASQAAYWHRVSPAAVQLAVAGFFSYGRMPKGRSAASVGAEDGGRERPAIAPPPTAQDVSWLDFGDKIAF